jgi:LytS/YehU family sensor histidine kinase
VSPLLLLPFVENAFKHGAGESRFASAIDVDIRLVDDVLQFNVKNTKENNDVTCDGDKIGLNNVRRQLELLYSDYDMHVLNEPFIFVVSLKINLKSYAQYELPDSGR